MGPGAMFVGMMAEVTIPTLLLFALCYMAMVGKRRFGAIRGISAFLVALIAGGAAYATTCLILRLGSASGGNGDDLSMVLILLLPLIASVAAIRFLAPKNGGDAGPPSGG